MEKLSIYQKLNKIQNELKAPKGQYNSFGKYKYRSCEDIFEAVKPLLAKYNLILTTSDELIYLGERYYIKAIAKLIDADEPYEEFNECKAVNCITNIGYAREEETKKGMDGSQITGASSSYARKYALNGLFLIDDTKDSDTTNVGEEITKEQALEYTFTKGKYKGKKIEELYELDNNYLQWWLDQGNDEDIKKMIMLITDMKPTEIPSDEEQIKRLNLMKEVMDLVEATNTDYEGMLAHFGVSSNVDMTTEQLEEAKKVLEQKL